MKTQFSNRTFPSPRWSLAIAAFICAASALSLPRTAAAITLFSPLDRDAADAASGSGSLPKSIKIQVVESGSQAAAKDVAWLGVSTEEASNALSAQLGMQPGDGLVVAFVQPDSPAAKAGLQKNDVLVEMGDQLLLHPGQFRKLVRRQKEGDKVQLTLFRAGKKLSLSATLAKTTERAGNLEDATREFQVQVKEPKLSDTVRGDTMVPWRSVRPYAGLFRQVAHVEDQRDIEEAREALNAALLRNRSFALALGPEAVKVQQWTKGNLTPSQTTTITLTKNAKSSRTFVKADETGTYVIMAGPTKHLTVHDKEGTVLFDGDIETPAQQEKVPAGFWQKAELMLEEMNAATDDPKAGKSEKEK